MTLPRRLPEILMCAVAGALLVVLAMPRVAAGVVAGPFDAAIHSIGRGEPLSDARLRVLENSRTTALAWYDLPRFHADLASVHFAQAQRAPAGSPVRAALIDRVLAEDVAALRGSPAQPYSWLRIVQAKLQKGGARADVSGELLMSYRTAPADPRLLLTRLEIALAVWPSLSPEARDATAGQIVRAMDWFPRELVEIAIKRYRLDVIRAALADDPVARTRFNLLYMRLRSQLS